MSPSTKTILQTSTDPIRAHDDPLGKVAWLTASGVVLALCVLTALALASRPIRRAFAILRDDGAVRATAPAHTGSTLARPEARARAVRTVRAALLPIFRRDREPLRAVLDRAPEGSPWRAARRLQIWARLREEWATALARVELSPGDYRRAARLALPVGRDADDLRALDLLLGIDGAGPASEGDRAR